MNSRVTVRIANLLWAERRVVVRLWRALGEKNVRDAYRGTDKRENEDAGHEAAMGPPGLGRAPRDSRSSVLIGWSRRSRSQFSKKVLLFTLFSSRDHCCMAAGASH